MAELTVRVVSPDRIVYEGSARSIIAPAWDGQVGIWPGHAPLLALLGAGELSLDAVEGGHQAFHLAGGVMKVERNQITVLTEYAGDEPPSEIPESAVVFDDGE